MIKTILNKSFDLIAALAALAILAICILITLAGLIDAVIEIHDDPVFIPVVVFIVYIIIKGRSK